MSLKSSVLASGSSGNIIYIESNETPILLDVGLSKKRTEILLNKIDKNLSVIKAIFVSHEHVDHIRGVGVINRCHDTLLYGNKDTLTCDKFKRITGSINPDSLNFIESDESIILDNLKFTAFSTSHDSVNSQFYMIEHKNKKLVCLSDIGHVNCELLSILKSADLYLIESNHDVDLLLNGNRPEFNKRRILSKLGHLSNEDCGNVLSNCINENIHTIVLSHMSNDHNNKSIALKSVKDILSKKCSLFSDSLNIIAFTQKDDPTDLIDV
ncbi:Hydroxyacylglutathione hydrolase [Candidatus Methanobinarius endosymbioticus]|uniref:Hydroxyacylglutathione hydrolase n=1 Tax=Candidatus Methanobinarius endosymbioticus TaxID=2006182 RepID=A0A366MA66_9EURY|nr:Hydroxyacylglutathione hydrolase [Candidatus Methanobinarius endosymbioticus]